MDQVDLNGDNDFVDAGEHDVSNTFNDANEQTARGGATPVYDDAGNLTDNDEDQKYTYDAWGRMVEVRNQSSALISRHRYNGLGYRIAWQYDLDADGTVETTGSNDDPWLYQVHDSSWRVVASVFAVDNGAGTEAGEHLAKADDDPRELFVFHTGRMNGRGTSSKLDDMILRDRDANTTWGSAGDGTAEERTYYAQNWRGDVIALLDSTGGRRETVAYSAYGVPFGRPSGDIDGLGQVNAGDFTLVTTALGESFGDPGYNVRVDINLDGTVDSTDSAIQATQSGHSLGRGNLSRNPSLAGGVGSRLGYAGYAWEPSASRYHVRHRVLDPVRGRWSKRDPLGYVDSPTMYAYVNNRAMAVIDSWGLLAAMPQRPEGVKSPVPIGTDDPIGCAPFGEIDIETGKAKEGCSVVAGGGKQPPPPDDGGCHGSTCLINELCPLEDLPEEAECVYSGEGCPEGLTPQDFDECCTASEISDFIGSSGWQSSVSDCEEAGCVCHPRDPLQIDERTYLKPFTFSKPSIIHDNCNVTCKFSILVQDFQIIGDCIGEDEVPSPPPIFACTQ